VARALTEPDGAPSQETVAKVYDYLDLMRAVEAFVNAYQGASVAAIFKGLDEAGVRGAKARAVRRALSGA
jgi:hypothetical protein